MSDLSKIDWSRCEIGILSERMSNGDLRSIRIRPVWDEPHRNPVLKLGEPGSSVAALTGNGWQMLEGAVLMTIDQVEFVLRYMKHVAAFIESELKRMAEEALPPWRECALEEAMANPECSECKISEPPVWSGWFPARWINWLHCDAGELKTKARFHTRAPKAALKRRKITGEQAAIELLRGNRVYRGSDGYVMSAYPGGVARIKYGGNNPSTTHILYNVPRDILEWNNSEVAIERNKTP